MIAPTPDPARLIERLDQLAEELVAIEPTEALHVSLTAQEVVRDLLSLLRSREAQITRVVDEMRRIVAGNMSGQESADKRRTRSSVTVGQLEAWADQLALVSPEGRAQT